MEQHDVSTVHHEGAHTVSYARYLMIWVALMMLTGLTVAVA